MNKPQPGSSAAKAAELFEPPKLSIDRLPQLRTLFERVTAGCVEDYKELIAVPVSCFLNQVDAGDSWDIVDGFDQCIAAVYYVSEWDANILLCLEHRLLLGCIDVMYGADGSEPQVNLERALSGLELNVAKELFERAARCLASAFAPLCEITPSFERIETEIEFTILGPQNLPSVYAQLLFQILDNGGRMFILVPRAPLMPMRKKLERTTLKDSQADDPRWTKRMQSKVATTNVSVRAVAAANPLSLGAIAGLRPGMVLPLDSLSRADIVLETSQTSMFKCSLGQLDGHLSVRIEGPVEPPRGLLESVLGDAIQRTS